MVQDMPGNPSGTNKNSKCKLKVPDLENWFFSRGWCIFCHTLTDIVTIDHKKQISKWFLKEKICQGNIMPGMNINIRVFIGWKISIKATVTLPGPQGLCVSPPY